MTTETLDTDENGAQTGSGLRDFAERTKAENATLTAEKSALARENAFLKAGVDPDSSPIAKDFYRAYDGDLTADAVRAAAQERNLIQAPAPDQTAVAAQQGQAAVAAMSTAATTSGGATSYQDAQQELMKAFNEGGQEAMSAVAAKYGIQSIIP